MARPRKDCPDQPAQERLKSAFWALLENNPYNKITIKQLATAAKVNHNTIYRYYSSIDDLAMTLYHEILATTTPGRLIEAYRRNNMDFSFIITTPEAYERWHRLCLFYRGDSPLLINYGRETMCELWLKELGVSFTDLTPQQQAELEFIFAGIGAIASKAFMQNNPDIATIMLRSELGQAVLASMLHIKDSTMNCNSQEG